MLSKIFGEACCFGTHRVVDYHAWAKAVDGNIVRAYSFLGETGEILVDQGELTTEELANDLRFTDVHHDPAVFPNEEDVLLISRKWTVDTMNIDKEKVDVGIVGKRIK